MNGTLPLFQELEAPNEPGAGSGAAAPRPAAAQAAGQGGRGGLRRAADAGRAADSGRPREAARPGQADRHLRAAWRLARSMGRYADGSPEQTRAGLAICRHLQALLAASDSR